MRSLPTDFEARYVASRTLNFLPLFGTVALMVFRGRSAFALPTVAMMVFELLLTADMARRHARLERPLLQTHADENPALLRESNSKAKSDVLPATIGGLLSGGIIAVLMKDARWLLLGLSLSALLLVGLALRWLVYDRWLDRLLCEGTSA